MLSHNLLSCDFLDRFDWQFKLKGFCNKEEKCEEHNENESQYYSNRYTQQIYA